MEVVLTQKSWEELVGAWVGEGYLLRGMIGCSEEGAVYQTLHGEEPAAIKLWPMNQAMPPVPQVEHPHLLRLIDSGSSDLSGCQFHYMVMELADENLASVIASRALSADEAQEMLAPVLEALGYLHERGLTHGSIKPSNIFAKGDSIKLSVDSIRPMGAAASPEGDMRALGLTIIEVLTQERQTSGIAEVPQPLRDIVEHSLQADPMQRWTSDQAAMRLSGAAAPGEARQAAPAAVRTKDRLIPWWVLPAAVVVMVIAVWFTLSRGSSSGAASNSASSVTSPSAVASRSTGTSTTGAPVAGPSAVRSAVVPQAPKPSPMPPPPGAEPARRGWFVVVASYSRDADAGQKARDLNRRFPQFKASVFPPSAIDTHYVVIIGSGLSEEKAESLRQRAVAAGLPADTYIKRYPQPRP